MRDIGQCLCRHNIQTLTATSETGETQVETPPTPTLTAALPHSPPLPTLGDTLTLTTEYGVQGTGQWVHQYQILQSGLTD